MKIQVQKQHLAILLVVAMLFLSAGYVLLVWEPWHQADPPTNGSTPPEAEPPVDADPLEPIDEPEPEPVDPAPEPAPPTEPDPAPTPEPTPEPDPAPPANEDPDTPIIYVDQQLIIPVSGGGTGDVSKVVKEGMLSGGKKQIALTFDAGWLYDQTIPLLDVLAQYQVKSTFFPRAQWVKDNPDLAREIVRRGHILENHSLTHGDMSKMAEQEIITELRESTRILQEITGSNPYLFRPPYGAYNNQMLKILAQEGYPYTIMWTVDTHDWAHEIGGQQVTADYLANRVLNNSSDNGIILMHIGGYKTVEALPRIITGLREQGYKLVTVNEMMPPPTENVLIHTVRRGDTLYSISQQYGVTINQLILANGLR